MTCTWPAQNLTDATQYVKQQRTAYDRFNDTSVTKSLMRVIENAQQIDREIQYKIALTGEATLNTDDLRRYTYEQRLTGIILMNEHGVVQREYSTDGLDYARPARVRHQGHRAGNRPISH